MFDNINVWIDAEKNLDLLMVIDYGGGVPSREIREEAEGEGG